MEFYICRECGNIIAYAEKKGCIVKCCGKTVEKLNTNSVDASSEKHVPVIKVDGNIVTVEIGEFAHPMTAEHWITWVALQTKQGNQRKVLNAGSEPKVQFAIVDGDEVVCAYAYCNLHGLWVKEFND